MKDGDGAHLAVAADARACANANRRREGAAGRNDFVFVSSEAGYCVNRDNGYFVTNASLDPPP